MHHAEGITLISFFKAPVTNTKSHQSITLTEAYHYITGNAAKQRTQTLRSIKDPQKARLYKAANFDYCTFSGIFTSRNDKALLQHSGLLCLDFDHLPNIEHTFTQLKADKNLQTKLLFRSPSGDGLKWIIAIDLLKATHAEYFKAVSNYINKTYNLQRHLPCLFSPIRPIRIHQPITQPAMTTQTRISGHLDDETTPVVGICEDFNFQPAQFKINPYAFLFFGKHSWDIPRHAYVRTIAGTDIAGIREGYSDWFCLKHNTAVGK